MHLYLIITNQMILLLHQDTDHQTTMQGGFEYLDLDYKKYLDNKKFLRPEELKYCEEILQAKKVLNGNQNIF